MNKNELNCEQLSNPDIYRVRKSEWEKKLNKDSNFHPAVGAADTRLLNRMRCSAVSAVYGAGMHPNRELWVPNPREVEDSGFIPKNIHKS